MCQAYDHNVSAGMSLAACGNSASQTGQPSTEEKPAAGTVDREEPAENTDTSEGQTNESEDPEDPVILEEQGTNVLVAYFSATNTTQGIAEHIANGFSSGGAVRSPCPCGRYGTERQTKSGKCSISGWKR